jgi:hypothetical protein
VYQQSNGNKNIIVFLTIYIKSGKVNECQSNGITSDNVKTQIKSGWALLAPTRP